MRHLVLLFCLFFTIGSFATSSFAAMDWTRGSTGSAYVEWQSFDDADLDTTPDASSHIRSAALRELTGQSFVSSSGNLYSLGAQSFTLTVATNSSGPSILAQNVNVQLLISTWGNPVDTSAVRLNGKTGSASLVYQGLDTDTGNWPQVDYLLSWQVAASSLYQFQFDLNTAHTSLNALVLDMFGLAGGIGLLPLPGLPIPTALAGNPIFNGSALDVDYFADRYNAAQSELITTSLAAPSTLALAATSEVPLPGAAWLLASSLLALAGVRSRKG